MLVLSRRQGESVQIDDCIRVTVVRVIGNRVTISIEAPKTIRIVRGELPRKYEVDQEGSVE